MSLTIFCDTAFSTEAVRVLREGIGGHRLVFAISTQRSNLVESVADPIFQEADVAFGQPSEGALIRASRVRWAHLTSAGYTRYDRPEVRFSLAKKGVALTTSSSVYAEPCAEHVLSMMLAMARCLPDSFEAQRTEHSWESEGRRERSFVLRGQTVLLLGYGAIGRRLTALLAPFEMRILAMRRSRAGDEPVTIVHEAEIDQALAIADHVVNVLPENASTRGFLSAERIGRLRDGAFLYNVGRGSTVAEGALLDALYRHRLGGAYLDVTETEPLPVNHPLWSAPRCFITPHSAGGQRGEQLALVRHFLENLRRFEAGEGLGDRVL